ncbi:hypothetical protein WJX73_003499 [Symbiochloris irregularis]|uniref:Uncharacterized protein n=1 Tax=Symbiochloris irregularis TaxID=706552 RepID=A0AAW1NQG7_9CHLO
MTEAQLKEAISLGERIASGKADLVLLDQKSLKARGKGQTKYAKRGKQQRESAGDDSERQQPPKKKVDREQTPPSTTCKTKHRDKSLQTR